MGAVDLNGRWGCCLISSRRWSEGLLGSSGKYSAESVWALLWSLATSRRLSGRLLGCYQAGDQSEW